MNLRILLKVVGISALAWMAWGTWIVLRHPTRFFGSKQAPMLKTFDLNILAFLGFFMTTGLIIFVPANFILGFIIPASWGAHGDNGEWISWRESLSGLVAVFGFGWVLLKMAKRYK